MRGAVFVDRDGTLVADPGYLHDPDQVVLLPHVSDGLACLARAGWPLVVVSNQSGIARGLYGPDAFHRVMGRIGDLLAPHGVAFAGAYFCPHHPAVDGPCPCRKPGTLLFERAAGDLALDLKRSWYVGDRVHDAEPALRLGGRGLVVARDASPEAVAARDLGFPVVPDLAAAAALIGAPAA
jgi:D-glycero-D-manno-heptose 1,7-bisphosphate phosphatase